MPPEVDVDYCKNSAKSECESPFQAELQTCLREESNASSETRWSSPAPVKPTSDESCESTCDTSCESACSEPVKPASDASCETAAATAVTAMQKASDRSNGKDNQEPCPKERPLSMKEEIRSTVEMFRRAADGVESVDDVLEEINRDREKFGIGSRRDDYYSRMINRQLIRENLLPEISFLYAKENFEEMSRRGRITEKSYVKFRSEETEDSSPVDRLLNRCFMTTLDRAGSRGRFGLSQKYFDMKDLDDVIDSARDYRFKKATEQREVKEMLSFLAEDDGKRFDLLADEKAGGITRKSIKQARREEDADDRRTLNKILKAFRELSVHDRVITKADIQYFSEKHGIYEKPIRFGY